MKFKNFENVSHNDTQITNRGSPFGESLTFPEMEKLQRGVKQ